MGPQVPPYFDALIAAFHQGRAGRFVHLGWWDAPPAASELQPAQAFEQAQRRLNERMLDLADLADGQCVVDVGCGLGGTLAEIDDRWRRLSMLGINIDPRQLDVCASLRPAPSNTLRWIQADACALPLPDASVDRLLCIEAMFHFPSRRRFFAEAARVLVPGGLLVASDIVVALPDDGGADHSGWRQALVEGFGPWPDLAGADADHAALAAAAGLLLTRLEDASAATVPSHHFTAPAGHAARDPLGRAAAALAALHRQGRLRYALLQCRRR